MMQERHFVFNTNGGNQTIHRTSDGNPFLAAEPVKIGRMNEGSRGSGRQTRERGEIVLYKSIFLVICNPAKDLRKNNIRYADHFPLLKEVFQRLPLGGLPPTEEINPDGGINKYHPATQQSSGAIAPPSRQVACPMNLAGQPKDISLVIPPQQLPKSHMQQLLFRAAFETGHPFFH